MTNGAATCTSSTPRLRLVRRRRGLSPWVKRDVGRAGIMLDGMSERFPSDDTARVVVRCGEQSRDRLNAVANGRSANVEALKALGSRLDLAEHGQQVAEEMRSDGPAPERVRGTRCLPSDDGGRITKRTLISEWEEIEAERGIHADDVRIIPCSREDEANDPVKARMAADVRKSRYIAEARTEAEGTGEAQPDRTTP